MLVLEREETVDIINKKIMGIKERYSCYTRNRIENNDFVTTQYRVGDVIKIVSSGGIYPSYTNAIHFFNLQHKLSNLSDLEVNKNYKKMKWVVVNIAVHESFDHDILLHISNKKGGEYIISEKYVKKVKMPKHISNRLKHFYHEKDFQLKQINKKGLFNNI